MNTTQFLVEVADVLDDPDMQIYDPQEIVRHGDRQLRGLYRTLVESNKDYSNFTMALQQSAALNPMVGVYEYRLPLWVMAVTRVWVRNGTPASTPNLSIYTWTANAAQIGSEIEKYRREEHPGWEWQGTQTLRLRQFSAAQDLLLSVVVRPARMAKAELAEGTGVTTTLYLPPTMNYGSAETEEGAYINSDWEVSGTSNANGTAYGDVRRCIYNDPAYINAGVRYHQMTFDSAFTAALVQGDTVETVLALPDEHTRLLVLQTARACFQKKNNIKALESIQAEMLSEQARFQAFATPPRDSRGPSDWKRPNPFSVRRRSYPWYQYPFGGI